MLLVLLLFAAAAAHKSQTRGWSARPEGGRRETEKRQECEGGREEMQAVHKARTSNPGVDNK